MRMQALNDTRDIRRRYEALIEASDSASVYQTLEWLLVFESLSYDLVFVEVDEDTLIPFVCRGKGALRRAFSLPYDTYGGPVATTDKPISYDEVLSALDIPSARLVDFVSRIRSSNCRVEETTTHIVDLSQGYEHAATHYSKMNRKSLRQADNRHISIKAIDHVREIRAFYNLYRRTTKKYRTPALPIKFFTSIYQLMVPKGLAKFYLAWFGDKAVAGNLVLRFKNEAYDWTWGYDEEHLNLRPTNALIDRAIRDEIEAGSILLNLGASPQNGFGSVKFKESFGAQKYSYKIFSRMGRAYHAARMMKRRRTWLNGKLRLW